MTFYYTLNQNSATLRGEVYKKFKDTLVTAGWSVAASSNGTTASLGDLIVSNAVMEAQGAWFVVESPIVDGYKRYICLQVSTSTINYNIRVKLSWTGFNLTGLLPLQVPAATDEQIIYGGGTDASPTFSAFLDSIVSNITYHVIAGDATEKTFFALLCSKRGVGTPGAMFFMDNVSNYHVNDIDPFVYYIYGSSSFPATALNSTTSWEGGLFSTSAFKTWLAKGLSNQSFEDCISPLYSSTVNGTAYNAVGALGVDPYDGNAIQLPMICLVNRPSRVTITGYKGKLVNIKYMGTALSNYDTLDLQSRVIIGALSFPWDGVTTPIL